MGATTAETKLQPDRSSEAVELTILMPCLNEAETIGVCVQKAMRYLEQNGVRGEVVVADNGSTDGSQGIATALGARVVPVKERGYGAALIGGINAARGRYTIMGDADDSYDFSNLGPFVDRLRGGAQLVMGNRFRGGIAPGAMPPLHRHLGNPILSFLGRTFFSAPVRDFHCGLRGFDTEAVRRLELVTRGMEFASEMVVRAALEKYRIEEVPTTLSVDGRSRAPHLKTWRDGWRHLKFLLMYSPRWLFMAPGAILTFAGLLMASWLWFGPARLPGGAVLGVNSFAAACFAVIAGVQVLSFGVLARIYATITGMLPEGGLSNWLRQTFSTDVLVRVAAAAFLAGAAVFGIALFHWASLGFGDLDSLRPPRATIAGLSLMVIGVQIGFQAFIIGIFEIPLQRRLTGSAQTQEDH